jgi:hypothetical protein
LISNAHAQPIYKWTDQSGQVHYGDSDSSAKNSKQITISQPPATSQQPPNSPGAIEAPKAGNLQACLSLARSMVDNRNMTPSEIRAQSKQLLGLCPGTAYECVTYLERPEGNSCKAVPLVPNGHMTFNRTYRR